MLYLIRALLNKMDGWQERHKEVNSCPVSAQTQRKVFTLGTLLTYFFFCFYFIFCRSTSRGEWGSPAWLPKEPSVLAVPSTWSRTKWPTAMTGRPGERTKSEAKTMTWWDAHGLTNTAPPANSPTHTDSRHATERPGAQSRTGWRTWWDGFLIS